MDEPLRVVIVFVVGCVFTGVVSRLRRRHHLLKAIPRYQWTLDQRLTALSFDLTRITSEQMGRMPERIRMRWGSQRRREFEELYFYCFRCADTRVTIVDGSELAPMQGRLGVYCLRCGIGVCIWEAHDPNDEEFSDLKKLLPRWEPRTQLGESSNRKIAPRTPSDK
jgi:hypothetical protein